MSDGRAMPDRQRDDDGGRPGGVSSVLLLCNPEAGGADVQALDGVVETWAQLGVSTRRHVLGEDGDDVDLVDLLAAAERAVIAGGDGTIHRVLTTLSEREALPGPAFGIIPLGTGNDLAGSLELPPDPTAAARTALRATARSLDLLRDDRGVVVTNAAHIGIGALAAERAQTVKGVLGPLGYAVGAVLAGASMADYPIRVEVDGVEVASADQQLLMAGLAVGRTIGGGTPLAPQASPDDGMADVILVSATGALARADFARRLRRGTHPGRDDVLVLRGRRVCVEAGAAPLNVDGELLGETGARCWTVLPRAWSVVVPG